MRSPAVDHRQLLHLFAARRVILGLLLQGTRQNVAASHAQTSQTSERGGGGVLSRPFSIPPYSSAPDSNDLARARRNAGGIAAFPTPDLKDPLANILGTAQEGDLTTSALEPFQRRRKRLINWQAQTEWQKRATAWQASERALTCLPLPIVNES